MLELRKNIFADERNDNLKEIGKPTQRQDMLGPCHRHDAPISTITSFAGHAASRRCCAARITTPASAASTSARPSERPASRVIRARRRAA